MVEAGVMTRVVRGRHAAWAPIVAGVVETIGSGTALYKAALRARLGRDPAGAKFARLLARLPAQDQTRLWDSVKEHRGEARRAS